MMNIRKATQGDVAGIAKVHIDSWRTTYKNIVPDDYLDSLNYEERKKRWEQIVNEGIVYVAEHDGKIVGFSSGGKEREGKYDHYDGELYAIYILQDYQGKGIGKKLVKPIVDELTKVGFRAMLVWVLKDNDATYFYEKLGGQYVDSAAITIGSAVLKEIAYGWPDINALREERWHGF